MFKISVPSIVECNKKISLLLGDTEEETNMGAWDPDSYLGFKSERTQPAIDLVARISLERPESIVDIGCGPGNSTAVLASRWPEAEIVGMDSSEEMIAAAAREYPEASWRLGNAAMLEPREGYDLVFSNALLQWIPRHEELLPRLMACVKPGGALAAQIPRFDRMPISDAIEAVASDPRWRAALLPCSTLFTYRSPDFYYGELAGLSRRVELWESSYYHVLASPRAVLDFVRTTALKPYLERLDLEADRAGFESALLRECEARYPAQPDGRVLFPFQRFFFVAYKD
jgi:trans-aconitate 2-methyltransferase